MSNWVDKLGPGGTIRAMDRQAHALDRNRLSVLLAVLLFGSVLFRFIELPEQVWRLEPFGSPLEIYLTGETLLVTLMVGVVCTGTNLVLHAHPHLGEHPGRPIYIAWILPGVMAGLSAYLLSGLPTSALWIGGLAVVGVAIGLTIAAEYRAISPETPGYARARLTLNVLAYLLVFILYTVIYRTRTRSLVTATLTLTASALIALDLLSIADIPIQRVLPFAGIIGIVIGQSTWALNYWYISAWVGGLFLLLIFYVMVNIAHQHLLEQLKPTILVELAVITIAVLAIILLRI